MSLINPSGVGTVSPVIPTVAPVVNNGIGLSTQLIIWGMVGFILVELLAILCLLRYCCRARYIRKRKFKEKEIILSDSQEPKSQYFLGRKTISGIDTSQQPPQPYIDERQSVSSLHPILPIQQHYQQETIMIDDISTPIYSKPHPHPHQHTKSIEVITHQQTGDPTTMDPTLSGGSNILISSEEQTYCTEENRMRQELSSEDIYTLRFSTSVAPVDRLECDSTAVPRQQQSYMYNGSLNRPAFEIISHADVRPTTPIRFEHVKEFRPPSPPLTTIPDFIGYNSCSLRHQEHQQPHHIGPLLFGDERSFADTGERVEWQMANELRTTDWERLKELTAKQQNDARLMNIDEYHRAQNLPQRIYERVAHNDQNDVNTRHIANKSSANNNCSKTSSSSRRQILKLTNEANVDVENNARVMNVDDPNYFNNNAQSRQYRHPGLEASSQQKSPITEHFLNDVKTVNDLIEHPTPTPAQFKQQQHQHRHQKQPQQSPPQLPGNISPDFISSRKSSIVSQINNTRDLTEAFQATNEIDLNNDSISLYTLHQPNLPTTPSVTRVDQIKIERQQFESVLGELKQLGKEAKKSRTTSDADLLSNVSIMSTNSAHLY